MGCCVIAIAFGVLLSGVAVATILLTGEFLEKIEADAC